MEPNQGIKTWQWVVTVIVIIILIILGYYLFKGNNNAAVTGATPSPTETPAADAKEVNRIVVSDQYPGNVVYISSVQLANPAWVEIHKDNKGTPGAVIGSAYVDKGINPVKITLTEKTVNNGVYYAMIHSDDGDKKYDGTKDLPMKDSMGNVIMKIFHAAANLVEVKG